MATSLQSARQPAGIYVVFFAEMWERFSYYGMRALLVLYLVNALDYQRSDALLLYGIYTGLVYLTPMVGGALADRYLGKRRAAVIGGLVMMLGHVAMAFEPLLHTALGLLIVGNGFFKPNMASMVGELYTDRDDPRRAGGYSIYYMGVNLGAFLAPLVAGTLGEKYGWHWGFGAAAVGMLIGLIQFIWQQNRLERSGLLPSQAPISRADWRLIGAWTLGSALFVVCALQLWTVIGPLYATLPGVAQIGLAFMAIVLSLWRIAKPNAQATDHTPLTVAEYKRIAAIVCIMIFVIAFWTGFEQAGGTMALFADQQTDRMLGSFEVPASWFQSINPLVIIALAPVFALLWTHLDRSRYALGDSMKTALGIVVVGLGFIVMSMAQSAADSDGKAGMHWLFAVFFIHTLGELMVSPVGLSMVSRVAPARILGLMMGIWFLSSAAANYLAGALEHMLEGSGIGLYPFLAVSVTCAGVLLALISRPLERWMRAT